VTNRDHSSGSALTNRIFDLLDQAELAEDAPELRRLLNLIDNESTLTPAQQVNRYYYRSYLARLSDNIETACDEAKAGLELAEKCQLTTPAARMSLTLGVLYNLSGHSTESIVCLKKARTLLEDSGELYLESEVRRRLSSSYLDRGDYTLALKEAETSLKLDRKNNNSHGEAFSLRMVGRVYNRLGRCHEAREMLNEAVNIFRRYGDDSHEALTLVTLGVANRNLAKLDEAEQAYLRAIKLAKERDLPRVLANATNNLGTLYSLRGNLDAAQEHYQDAYKLFTEREYAINAMLAYNNIGGIHIRRGEYDKAEKICKEVLSTFREIENRSGVGTILFDLGMIQFLRGSVEDGQTKCNQGIEIAMELGEHRKVHQRLHEVAWFLTISREQAAATRYFARANAYLPEKSEVENLQRILAVRAWHQFGLGNIEKALKLTQKALRQSEESGKTLNTVFVQLIHGRLLLATGELEKAGKELLETRQGYVELQMPFYEALSCRALADYYHKLEQSDKRDATLKEGLELARRISAMKLIQWFEELLENFAYNE